MNRQAAELSKHLTLIDTTDTLKGIAISAVLINHYLNLNISGDWSGFAYQWVSIFFLLSGYGLFHSFERRFHSTITAKEVLIYYYQRAIRIFPLLWVAWSIQLIISHGDISYWIPLGINGSGHYWFIPALLQCYVLSPFLYWILQKNRTISIIAILVIFITINILLSGGHAPHLFIRLAKITNSKWMKMYFFHIIVFTGGLILPSLLRTNKSGDTTQKQKFYSLYFWIFTASIVFIFAFIKYYSHISPFFPKEFFLLPLIMIIMLAVYALRKNIQNAFFTSLGRISYSIYLFHISFYLLISNIGQFPQNSLSELLLSVILFPFFIYLCHHIEHFGNSLAGRLKALA